MKIPENFDDLMNSVKPFRSKGITLITVPGKDRWPAMFFQNALALRTAGAQGSIDALEKKTSFASPEFVQSAELLKQLVDAKAFNEGCVGLGMAEGEQPFLDGKIPMYYMGNWAASMLEADTSKVKGKVVAAKFPVVNGGKGNSEEFLGGSIEGFAASAQTKNKDVTVKTLKYLVENLAREGFMNGGLLPSWKVDIDSSKVNPLTMQIVDLTKNSKAFVLAWDTFLSGADAETHKNLVMKIFVGKSKPEDFANEMQKQINEKK